MNALVTAQPILKTQDGRATTNSLDVAAFFKKRHADVLRAIERLRKDAPTTERNFALSSFVDGSGGRCPATTWIGSVSRWWP